jgi:cytochrome P450
MTDLTESHEFVVPDSPANGANEATSDRVASVPAGWPVMPEFDPLTPEQAANPYDVLAKARVEMPVFYMPKLDLWCLTRVEDVREALRDTERFSNSHEDVGRPPSQFADQIPEGHPVAHSLDSLDPPQHTRVRKLAQKAFTPRQVGGREGDIRAICDELMDGFIDRGHADLVSNFTTYIPVRVIAEVLGVPRADAPTLKGWTDDWFQIWLGDDPPEVRLERWQRTVDFNTFIRAFVEERRTQPKDDLTSELVHAKSDDGEPSLSTWEVICVVAGIVAAGSDTTSVLIAETVYQLLNQPATWERVKADTSLIPRAIEETMRLRNVVRGVRRVTKCPVELGGTQIPEGAAMYVHLGAANHDEALFERPGEFDIDREGLSDHLGFGKWTHFCLGAPLARLESRVAMECVVERLPGLRLSDSDREGLQYHPNAVIPGVRHLDVLWD